jgi:hypothetical protein
MALYETRTLFFDAARTSGHGVACCLKTFVAKAALERSGHAALLTGESFLSPKP